MSGHLGRAMRGRETWSRAKWRARLALVLVAALCVACGHKPAEPTAEVIHWWTSGGESAAVRSLATAYEAAGGKWQDTPVALGEQARAVTLSRIVGGNPPTVAQFNTTRQFRELVEQGMLANIDAIAARDRWSERLPAVLLEVIRVRDHYYAAPVDIHMLTWIWYSEAAFRAAGIQSEPRNMQELFAALDRLKAAGIVPLAHGGQPWQDSILFTEVLANGGGRELYLKIFRDHDAAAIASPAFAAVLGDFRRLRDYVDAGSPGRNWNDATAMVISGKAGVQIMGDWAKGEFAAAGKVAGRDYGCIAGFGADSPYIIQGDVFVFPKSSDPAAQQAQQLMASVITQPSTQLEFSRHKGSLPIRTDVDDTGLDDCGRKGMAILRDPARAVGNGEVYMTPDQNGALADILTKFWHSDMSVADAQRQIAGVFAR